MFGVEAVEELAGLLISGGADLDAITAWFDTNVTDAEAMVLAMEAFPRLTTAVLQQAFPGTKVPADEFVVLEMKPTASEVDTAAGQLIAAAFNGEEDDHSALVRGVMLHGSGFAAEVVVKLIAMFGSALITLKQVHS